MPLYPATQADFPAIIALANLAYRGTGSASTPASWNIEAGILEGQRLNDALLREELSADPQPHLLTWRDTPTAPILGTVLLQPHPSHTWHLGLFTVDPHLQNRRLGRTLLAAAEAFALARGAASIEMSVLNVRDALIAWYLRRGYLPTGKTTPFPYGDVRFGKPLRADLHFITLQKTLPSAPPPHP